MMKNNNNGNENDDTNFNDAAHGASLLTQRHFHSFIQYMICITLLFVVLGINFCIDFAHFAETICASMALSL